MSHNDFEAARDVNVTLLKSAIDGLSDSQFLGYVAMQLQSVNDPLTDHIATRLDLIALRLVES